MDGCQFLEGSLDLIMFLYLVFGFRAAVHRDSRVAKGSSAFANVDFGFWYSLSGPRLSITGSTLAV